MSVTPVDNPSLKWKGPSSGGTTVPIEYDVDDPTFCSPRSVLSGLASGFCERWAVTHPEFIVAYNGGNSTTLNWNDTNSSAAYRTSIVSNFVENIIAHNAAVESAFCENNGDFTVPEHPVTNSSANYMTYMDNMITQLITSGGYATSNQGASFYGTFGELAASGSRNASSNGSPCSLPVENGSAYTGQFLPAYPVAWAKERKWMLEQLRFCPVAGSMTSIGEVRGYAIDDYDSRDPLFYEGTPAPSATSAADVMNLNSAMQIMASLTVLGGSNQAVRQSGGVIGGNVTPSTSSSTYRLDAGYATYLGYKYTNDYSDSTYKKIERPFRYIVDEGGAYTGFLYGLDATVPSTASGTSVNINVYLTGPVLFADSAVNEQIGVSSVIVDGGLTNISQTKDTVIIKNGGTAAITGANTVISYVCVSSGCTLSVGSGAQLRHCNILMGGKLIPIDASLKFNVLSEDYKPLIGSFTWQGNVASPTALITAKVIDTAVTAAVAGTGFCVIKDGGVVSQAATAASAAMSGVVVLPGGSFITNGAITVSAVAILGTESGNVQTHGSAVFNHASAYTPNLRMGAGGFLQIMNNGGGILSATTMSGSTVSFGNYANDVALDFEYGTNLSFAAKYTNGTESVNAIFAGDSVTLTMFHNYGLTASGGVSLTSGWNSLQTATDKANHCVIAGTTTTPGNTEKTAIANGSYTFPYATEYGYTPLLGIDSFGMRAGMRVLAINGGTVKPVVQDMYPSFKLRQNQT